VCLVEFDFFKIRNYIYLEKFLFFESKPNLSLTLFILFPKTNSEKIGFYKLFLFLWELIASVALGSSQAYKLAFSHVLA